MVLNDKTISKLAIEKGAPPFLAVFSYVYLT